jgi:hypothetical protein
MSAAKFPTPYECAETPEVVASHGPWRCFHCAEVFTEVAAAAEHFGIDHLMDIPACKLNALEGGLVKLLRDQEAELRRFRMEDTESCRYFYALGSEHATKLRREEEKGYASGVKDASSEANIALKKRVDAIRDILIEHSPGVIAARSGLPGVAERHPIPVDALGKLWSIVKEIEDELKEVA